jgi:hypothetical protein
MDVFTERCQAMVHGGLHCWKKKPCRDHCATCDGTGVTDGTPERFTAARCPDCYCEECGFAPCQCIQPVTYQDDPNDD